MEKWRLVVFSDESKFNLFGSDGRQYCQRRVGEAFLVEMVVAAVKNIVVTNTSIWCTYPAPEFPFSDCLLLMLSLLSSVAL